MRGIVTAAVLLSMATPAFADAVYGVWKSQPNENGAYIHVRIGPCGDDAAKVCGTIVEQINSRSDVSVVGRRIIMDMEPDGPNAWDNGTIWAPDDDETYSSEMQLEAANVLKVSGCVLGGLICRGQRWTRVK